MKIAVRFLGFPASDSLREHSERQARLHLDRFGPALDTVEIRIREVNAARRGEALECKVSAKGPRFGFSGMVELGSDAYASVGLALARLSRSIGRALDRARGFRPSQRLFN